MRSVWIVLALLLVPAMVGAQSVERYPAGTPVPVPRSPSEGGTLPVPHRSIGSVSVGERAPDFELEWVSVYTFTCRCMESFRHGRVLFVGDAAHQVSPFGARGANSGLQDA